MTTSSERFRRGARPRFMNVWMLLVFSWLSAMAVLAQPAQVILIRHAEKPEDPAEVHLSEKGEKRARELVPFLTTDPVLTQAGLPVALFATRTTRHGRGQRTQETLAPLAHELGLPVQTPYLSEEYKEMARWILSNRDYEGKTVLICWNHEEIPQLTEALGVRPRPPKWKDSVFDRVYLITFPKGKATLADLPQTLSPHKPKHKKHEK